MTAQRPGESETPNLGELEQLVLLALIRLGSGTYGAELRREIMGRARRPVALTAVYTVLDRLESKGMVRSWIGDPSPERGGRRKKHFEILPTGQAALATAYRRLQALASGLEEQLAE